MTKQGNSTKGTNMKRMKGITGKIVAVLLTVAMLVPIMPSEAHAEIFYLQTGRRLDTDFYANYYPDLKAKYGYNAHKLLDHYINYGIFERRIPSMYYLNNMDALGIGEFVPKEILYQRKSLRKGCSEAQFFNAYDEARYFVCVPAKNAAPNNMYAQMGVVAQKLFDRVNYNPGVKYKIVGSGDCGELFSGMPNCEVVGFLSGERLVKVIKYASICVFPSIWYENCPMSILESIALGTPVIGSNIGGIPELIDVGKTGFVVKPGDSEALKNAVESLFFDQDLLSSMSKSCVGQVEMDDVASYVGKLTKIYSDLRRKSK